MGKNSAPRILVIDDNLAVGQALKLLFEVNDLHCEVVLTPQAGVKRVQQDASIALVVQDMNFSAGATCGNEGKQLFHTLREVRPELPIILMTAWTELASAVELVKHGAADYLAKPWQDERLVASARQLIAAGAEYERPLQEAVESADLCGVIYRSEKMRALLGMAIKVAASDVPVLVTGPNGAGKEQIAQILHANSPFKLAQIVKVNVGALPKDLMEAELFGAEKGAFTGCDSLRIGRFEAADRGTLFLDEIGNLSPEGQAKLLRVIQMGEFQRLGSSVTRRCQVRLITATNCDLTAAIERGEFREDLYYRLNVIELRVPALAERPEDILPLANAFLAEGSQLNAGVAKALQSYPWPGNVRELQNACRRAQVLNDGKSLRLEDFGLNASAQQNRCITVEPDEEVIRAALKQSDGVVAQAARSLGLSRQALYRRLQRLNIDMN